MSTIDLYNIERDEPAAVECWNAALGQMWPITAAMLRVMTNAAGPNRAGNHFVAREGERVAGFAVTQIQKQSDLVPDPQGHIAALVVAPWAQRRGIGTDLLNTALDDLRGMGVRRVQLGGRVPRFWPGIPTNLPLALDYFRVQGWQTGDPDWDITRSLIDYVTPPGILERVSDQGIRIEVARADEVPEALAFERSQFPGWYDEYAYPATSLGDHGDILIAREKGKGVVGTLIMYSWQSNPLRGDVLWRTLLGEKLGSLNAVGVAWAEQKRGIGLALVARGSEILKARGVVNAHIGWTSLTDFYGKLGYKVWGEYAMSRRDL
jgi:beta-N-acetylhexosaminidase